ncbi:uncharacterized protein LOC127876354 isoform X2 [Dreissena polymorpha]|nr:uncharacterized protein LOC127876354 isoform X2 [Dreissena polymorpha]
MFSDRKKLTLGKGRINVCVIKGDLTQEKVDVIVCTANKPLDLSKGRASRTILEAAGDGMADEVKASYPDGIDYGEVAVVNSGNLACKKVYFVALPVAGTGVLDDNKMLHNTVTMCLERADQSKFESLSIPALGTGLLKYTTAIVAMETIQSVEDFSNSNPSTSVKYVNVVVYYQDDDSFTAFEEEARGRAGRPINLNGVLSSSGPVLPPRAYAGVRSIMRGINYSGPQKDGCLGNISVKVVTGTLAKFKADVLVSNCGKDLKLKNGALAESLLEAAGSQLQDECDQNYPNGIRQGDVAVTSGYNLDCEYVFHGSLPNWDNKGLTAKKALCRFIDNCLKEAEQRSLSTMGIPALGTGSMKFPAKVSAEQTFQCISKFVNNYPQGTSLKCITIIVYDRAADCTLVKQAFDEALQQTLQENVDDDDAGDIADVEQKMQMKLLMTAAKNSLERTCAADPGTEEWFKFMYKSEPCSPSYWTTFHSRKTLKDWGLEAKKRPFIRLPIQGQDFQDVVKLVQDTWDAQHVGHGRDAQGLGGLNYTKVKVTKVERIENYELFHKYAVKRQELFKKALNTGRPFKSVETLKGSKGKVLTTSKIGNNSVLANEVYHEVNEHYMFHGTDVVDKIVEQGLDCRLAGQTAMFGQGVYCAESSTKSDQYADPKGMRSLTDRKMLLVRTCLGEPFVTSSAKSYARPPCKSCLEDKCHCSNNQFYDSVIGDGSWNFREFIVYNMTDVYPEYIVTYNRV